MTTDTTTLSDRAGGMPFFERLVGRFYAGVATDPILRPLYPEADLAPAQRRLTLFLAQYWGGPTTYNDERGHPRLRMRHMGFEVGPLQRDHWLAHMLAAVDANAPTACATTPACASAWCGRDDRATADLLGVHVRGADRLLARRRRRRVDLRR